MEFITSNVLWFLVAAVAFAFVAFLGQLRNIYKVTKMSGNLADFQKTTKSVIMGFIPVVVCGLAAAVCFVLFVVGVIGYFVK